MTDKFIVVNDPHRIGWFRIERVSENGHRFPIPRRFRSERVAQRTAYEFQAKAEQRASRRIYLGD